MAQGRLDINAFGWPLRQTFTPRLILVLALLGACLVSALAVISVSHQTRTQYARLQSLEREQQQLQTEWGQLLLEESAWSTPSRIESMAVERLEMHLPDIHDIEVIAP
uniref:cell division protein FtsL n=1 Tax=Halomonas sp. TaxID=1486246 RepID=UPI00261C3EA6|nr:cell division protein FtsL [Halomonas sp.]